MKGSKRSRPNIVMVITHDTGQHIECYGGVSVKTPNFCKLAEEGVLFTNYHCTAPQCSPSRGSILTGRYPHQNGLMGLAHRGWRLNEDEVTLGQLLQANGYSTFLFGFQHESFKNPERLGYQFIYSENYRARIVSDRVVEFLRNQGREGGETPFFAMVGFSETHRPFNAPGYEFDDPEEVELPPYLPDTPGIRQDIARLHGQVKAVDEAVGRILDALNDAGIEGNTLFIYTTDHGPALPRAKGMLYDPGTKTALLMRWPAGFDGGRVYEDLLINVDLLPTILDIAGVETPSNVAGRTFLPLLRGEAYRTHHHIFTELTWHDRYNPMRGVRTARYKYIRNFGDRLPLVYVPRDILKELKGEPILDEYYGSLRPKEELYDLAEDPLEMKNLANNPEYSEIKDELGGLIDEWMAKTDDPLLKGDVPGREGDSKGDCWEEYRTLAESKTAL